MAEAKPLIAEAVAADAGWASLLERLPAAGLFPDDPDLIATLLRDVTQSGLAGWTPG